MSGIYRIDGVIRHYDWGGKRFLPELVGRPADGQPMAEYWLGSHPSAPARVLDGVDGVPLDQLIADAPRRWLGPHADHAESLPYLFKLLDIERPLSIQLHPDRRQALAGYADEDRRGIPLDAPERNFRDRNPKPELAVALGEFWLVNGLRPRESALEQLRRFDSLGELARYVADDSTGAAFRALMAATPEQLTAWVVPMLEQVRSMSVPPDDPVYWIRFWLDGRSPSSAIDRGALALLLMNLVRLERGQGVYQAANVPHAYLRGQIVEIMANSDNVLRCGLTSKHVDPAALESHLDFDAGAPEVLEPRQGRYLCPATEFDLACHDVGEAGLQACTEAAEIWFALEGRARVSAGETTLDLDRGQAAILEADVDYTVRGLPSATVFQAKVGKGASAE